MTLHILNRGANEPLKAGIHGFALGLAAVMGLYNAAAFLRRRELHLAVNAVLYGLAAVWERKHVSRHLDACRCDSVGLSVSTVPATRSTFRRKAA